MGFYEFVVLNKEIFKLLYALAIIGISMFIAVRSHKIFKLSYYQGIRYLRNAFVFFALAFFSRYILDIAIPSSVSMPLFEFFMIVAGFFLLYSLIWKKFESSPLGNKISFLNAPILIFYFLALILVFLDILFNEIYFLFISQIVLFLIIIIISIFKSKKQKKTKFSKFYLAAIILMVAAWVLNFLALEFFRNVTPIIIDVYILNIVFFLIFLYGVLKLTRR